MSDHTSMMQMYSQETDPTIIVAESMLVAEDVAAEGYTADQIAFVDDGWSSRAYLVDNGKIVYKFPRSAEVMAGYEREIAALNLFASQSLPMATQRFRSLDPNGPYFSYYGLVGRQLTALLPEADRSAKYDFGRQIGHFLSRLHALELPSAPVVAVRDEVREYQDKYQLATPMINEYYVPREQKKVAEFFYEEMPDRMTMLGSQSKLSHGDLGLYNVIVDDEDSLGVIDFGNIGYYDQSKDFIDFGDADVLSGALEVYGDSQILREKIAVRTIAMQAIELVYYRSKHDEQGVQHAIDDLRRLLIEN
jgi:aminoglycoside phosphotransferase